MLLAEASSSTFHSRGGADQTAARAHAALIDELATWPKPGLVSRVDSGSHRDMNAGTLVRSADAIRPAFAELARAGERRASMAELRAIGRNAEAAMMAATGGVNAHRGAIFSLGLICAAEGARGYAPGFGKERARTVGTLWGGAIRGEPASTATHGGVAARRFGVGGAREEAASGFPTLCAVGLPALREGRRLQPMGPSSSPCAVLLCPDGRGRRHQPSPPWRPRWSPLRKGPPRRGSSRRAEWERLRGGTTRPSSTAPSSNVTSARAARPTSSPRPCSSTRWRERHEHARHPLLGPRLSGPRDVRPHRRCARGAGRVLRRRLGAWVAGTHARS